MRNYRKARHVMLDLETYDTATTAIVRSIGIACMDFAVDKAPTYRVEWALDIGPQVTAGRTRSEDTMAWWESHPEANAHVGSLPPQDPTIVLQLLQTVVEVYRPDFIWAQGASFDFPIITSLARSFGTEISAWKFYHERYSRTIISARGREARQQVWDMNPDLIPHSAASDAYVQLSALYEEIQS